MAFDYVYNGINTNNDTSQLNTVNETSYVTKARIHQRISMHGIKCHQTLSEVPESILSTCGILFAAHGNWQNASSQSI